MIYKQTQANSIHYRQKDGLTIKTQEEWLEKDPEAEFQDYRNPRDTGTLSKEFSNGGVIGGVPYQNYEQKRDKRDKTIANPVTRCDNCDSVTSVTRNLSTLASEWFNEVSGQFTTEQFDNDFAIRTPEEKANRRQIFRRAKLDGIIRQDKTRNNVWHKVDDELETLNPWDVGQAKVLPIKWAFGIENYVNLYAGDLVIVAGSKDAGKTALLLDTLYRNMDSQEWWYFSSEIGEERLKVRLNHFECDIDDWKKVNFRRRKASSNWADIIRPSANNIVDFLEIHEKFYEVATPLAEIHSKENKGIAIVALQKNKGAELAHGSAFTMEKASLYLSLDNGSLKIISAKSWAKEDVNPAGMYATFKLVHGCDFRQILPLGHHQEIEK